MDAKYMNKAYQHWESQFLDEMIIEFGFSGNFQPAFKYRLLNCYSDFKDKELAEDIKGYFRVKGDIPLAPDTIFRDCWIKIYKVLKKYGFDYKEQKNPDGKYDKSWEGVRKWLHDEKFPKYIENIKPETSIELWQELWTSAENSPNHLLQIIPKK